ncbi:MAG: TetR family transcriptional regulator [Burkholderiales bacterium]
MVIRQRAIQAEDKQERQQAILDAAARVLARSPDRIANVAEVADEAGLAKGTVYLYFPSKEELLLAVHERNIDGFFRALIDRLAQAAPVTVGDVQALTHRHIVEPPLFLPLAARCFGMMGQSVPVEAALAFKQRMAGRLSMAGAGLERHFRELKPGQGVALLRHSYALIIGLWQMSPAAQAHDMACAAQVAGGNSPVFDYDYAAEVDQALLALWSGTVGRPVAAAPAAGGSQ